MLDWKEAERHLTYFIALYASLEDGTGMLGLQFALLPLFRRYQSGERTQELYDDMMSAE